MCMLRRFVQVFYTIKQCMSLCTTYYFKCVSYTQLFGVTFMNSEIPALLVHFKTQLSYIRPKIDALKTSACAFISPGNPMLCRGKADSFPPCLLSLPIIFLHLNSTRSLFN